MSSISWYLSQIKYFSETIYIFLKDQLRILWLRPIKYFSERSIDNTWASHIWKISQKVQDFCLDFLENQLISQISWKDQGILRKKLHFLAADQFDQLIRSVDQNIKKCFLFKNIFWKKSFFYQLTDQLIQKSARSDQLIRSNQQVTIYQVIQLRSAHLDKVSSIFYQLINWLDLSKMLFFSKKILEKNISWSDQLLISKSAKPDQLIRWNQQLILDQTFSSGQLN